MQPAQKLKMGASIGASVDLRCTYCESKFPLGTPKCPYCGAPAPPPTASTKSGRLTLGAFILAALFVLGMFQSVVLIAQPKANLQSGLGFGVGDFTVHGSILNETGATVPNATVTALGPLNQSSTSGADGNYSLQHVTAGYYELEFRNATSAARLRVFVTANLEIDGTLPANGTSAPQDHASATRLFAMTQACGGIFLLLSFMPLAGAIACHRRRNWGLALAGAILGTFAALPLSILLGLFAVLVVASSRKDFDR